MHPNAVLSLFLHLGQVRQQVNEDPSELLE
jgi:hypothetical protein